MSDKDDTRVAAGTSLLENVMRMRREQGAQPGQGDDGEGQIKTRQLNLNAEEIGGPGGDDQQNIASKRKIQQPLNPTEDEMAEEERAHSALGRSLFGEKNYNAAKERIAKKAEGQHGDQGEEGQDEDEEKPDEQEKAEVKKPAKGTRVVRAPQPVSITREDLAQLSATIADAVRKPQQGQSADAEGEAEDDPSSGLGDDDRDMYEAAVEMSKSRPDRYKNLPQQMLECFDRKAQYRKEWEKEHPGERFDWGDQDHQSFLETVAPDYLEKDFGKSLARIEARRELQAEREKDAERISEIESKLVEATLKDHAAAKSAEALREFARDVIPEADYDLGTPDGFRAAVEGEDLIGEVIGRYGGIVDAATGELAKLFCSSGKYKFSPKNELHVWISDTIGAYERALVSKAPVNESGQRFLARSEYFRLPQQQRSNYWTIGEDQSYWIVRDHASRLAKAEKEKIVERMKTAAKARGWQFDPETIVSRRKSQKKQVQQAQQRQPQQRQQRKDTPPPESPSGGSTDTRTDKGASSGETFVSNVMSKLFPRRQKQQ